MRDKHQTIEEPCEGKLSCTVLKTNGVGDNLVEFTRSTDSNGYSIRIADSDLGLDYRLSIVERDQDLVLVEISAKRSPSRSNRNW